MEAVVKDVPQNRIFSNVEDDEEVDSISSFSLQECIKEFRERRMRRASVQSREMIVENNDMPMASGVHNMNDAELINQNWCNKRQERIYKPCRNGSCYCFTSDSGDAVVQENIVRPMKRNRKLENTQFPCRQQKTLNGLASKQQRKHQSISSNCKINSKHNTSNLTETCDKIEKTFSAISSLHIPPNDAPIIHIIQELRNNCVISEVHVNSQKIKSMQHRASWPEKHQFPKTNCKADGEIIDENWKRSSFVPPYVNKTRQLTTETKLSDIVHTSSLENSVINSTKSAVRYKTGGRLLQKRLSSSHRQFKAKQYQNPPPKPPRSTQEKSSVSSLPSSTTSVRQAERILDDFLRRKGVRLKEISHKEDDIYKKPTNKRNSYPQYQIGVEKKSFEYLPTCPSLSDIERVIESKKEIDYAKNMHKTNYKNGFDKSLNEVKLGWPEPKITHMLNIDTHSQNLKTRFKSQSVQAEPQTIGWQAQPKISIDTVDGGVCQNLASNIESKHTPIKTRFLNSKNGASRISPKFLWTEQLKNFSPWDINKRGHGKRNFTKSPKDFFLQSKKKILRIVSPKKDNILIKRFKGHENELRTIGVQTSIMNIDLETEIQTPPGSYHSSGLSENSGANFICSNPCAMREDHLKFKSDIKSITNAKCVYRGRPRKLEFPLCGATSTCLELPKDEVIVAPDKTETYHSYQTDLNQDINLSKMSHILSNIRSKLEASDRLALITFQDVEKRGDLRENGTQHQMKSFSNNSGFNKSFIEPIYSEIDEDSVHVSASSQYENNTAATLPFDVNELYSKVNKTTKLKSGTRTTLQSDLPTSSTNTKVESVTDATTGTVTTATTGALPLAKIMQESLKRGNFNNSMEAVPLPKIGVIKSVPNLQQLVTFSTEETLSSPYYQSLNNVKEQHSLPKQNLNLRKSDLSLHKSEIFLENLCQNKILIEQKKTENVDYSLPLNVNNFHDDSTADIDIVSYDLPNDEKSSSVGPNPDLDIQNVPKGGESKFITELPSLQQRQISHYNFPVSSICNSSFGQISQNVEDNNHKLNESVKKTSIAELECVNAPSRCSSIKKIFKESYRKGKRMLIPETCKSTTSSDETKHVNIQAEIDMNTSTSSSYNLDMLFNTDDSLSISDQLLKAVSLCRQLPQFEISAEMVEAERLLLFQTLQQNLNRQRLSLVDINKREHTQRFYIDAMKIPVRANPTEDVLFNYYYICTFECDSIIKSTQSVECRNGEAIFRDCGLEFNTNSNLENFKLHCKIFMLRLRKISNLSIDSTKLPEKTRNSIASSDSSIEPITSRFRQHASFELDASLFTPYELIIKENYYVDQICFCACNKWYIPISVYTKSSSLLSIIQLSGRIKFLLPKQKYSGFLNVQDPKILHNWNRRWCTLDGFTFSVWQDESTVTDKALLSIDLRKVDSINNPPKELCARSRTFLLKYISCEDGSESITTGDIFCAADTQSELNEWMKQINQLLDLANKWLR